MLQQEVYILYICMYSYITWGIPDEPYCWAHSFSIVLVELTWITSTACFLLPTSLLFLPWFSSVFSTWQSEAGELRANRIQSHSADWVACTYGMHGARLKGSEGAYSITQRSYMSLMIVCRCQGSYFNYVSKPKPPPWLFAPVEEWDMGVRTMFE